MFLAMHVIDEGMGLAAVRRYEVLDTPREDAFDRITSHAARLLNVPMVLMTVIDERRIWVKSSAGTDLQSTDRLPGFCASCIEQNDPWMIPVQRLIPAAS
jgi:hypothetical protein